MRNSKMQEVTMEVTVGFFLFILLLVLSGFSIFISQDNIFKETYEYRVEFDDVSGLRKGDNVHFRGVEFGKVRGLEMLKGAQGVSVEVSLPQPITLYDDYSIEIHTSSALGGKQIVINEGSADKPPLASYDNLVGKPPADLLEEATGLLQFIRTEIEQGGMLDNLAEAAEDLKAINRKINSGEGTLARLLNEDTLYRDLQSVASNLSQVSQRLNEGKGSLAKLLSEDETLYENLVEVSTNLKEVSDRLSNGEGTLGKLLSKDDQLYQNLLDTTEGLSSITKGEGTIARLLNDDELYQEFIGLVREARATVDDFRETSPFSAFSSVFFGAF